MKIKAPALDMNGELAVHIPDAFLELWVWVERKPWGFTPGVCSLANCLPVRKPVCKSCLGGGAPCLTPLGFWF
jgi:hypothetical protein